MGNSPALKRVLQLSLLGVPSLPDAATREDSACEKWLTGPLYDLTHVHQISQVMARHYRQGRGAVLRILGRAALLRPQLSLMSTRTLVISSELPK